MYLSHTPDVARLLERREFLFPCSAAAKRDHLALATSVENPWERLIEFGRLYIDFGMEHPD